MNSREREEFKEVILGEIESQKHQIESLLKSIKPIVPDNAIGRALLGWKPLEVRGSVKRR